MSRIAPAGDPVWNERVAALVAFLRQHPGADFAGIKRGPWNSRTVPRSQRWYGDMIRNVLAAAHPSVLELDGRWYAARDCARPAPAVDPRDHQLVRTRRSA